ncbi:MAG: branched-chain amino acid ABC transporter permease [Burkholderiales bacterium]
MSRAAWLIGLPAACAALALPFATNNYIVHVANYSLIFLLPALGLNLIFGYTGLLSLAQGAFFGIGAYAAALVTLHFGWPFWLALLFGGFFCAGLSLLLAIPALRLRAYSFVMCTLGFVFIAETVSKNWVTLTRGDMALTGITRPMLSLWGAGPVVSTPRDYYYVLLVLAVLAVGFFVWLVTSPAGRCLRAIRDEETLAESQGIPVHAYKMAAFALSAFYAGLGGSAYAAYETVVSPLIFQLYFTLLFLIMVFAGGAGTVLGVFIGAFLFVAIPEALRATPELRLLLYGFVFILFVFFLPDGVGPALGRLAARLRRRGSP